jgi:hypothetical protein
MVGVEKTGPSGLRLSVRCGIVTTGIHECIISGDESIDGLTDGLTDGTGLERGCQIMMMTRCGRKRRWVHEPRMARRAYRELTAVALDDQMIISRDWALMGRDRSRRSAGIVAQSSRVPLREASVFGLRAWNPDQHQSRPRFSRRSFRFTSFFFA